MEFILLAIIAGQQVACAIEGEDHMIVAELKLRLQQYHSQKGYGRWYLWGDSEIIKYLTYFLAAKNPGDNVSCNDFHDYLVNINQSDLLEPFTRDKPVNKLRSQLIFKPWLDELNNTLRNKIKKDAERCLDYKYPLYNS